MLAYRQKRCACAWEALAFHAGQVGEDGHDLYRQIRGGSVGSELPGQGQSSAGAHVSVCAALQPRLAVGRFSVRRRMTPSFWRAELEEPALLIKVAGG